MPSHRGTQATYHMDEEGEESQLPALRGTSLGGKGQVGLRVCLLLDLVLNPLPLVSLLWGILEAGGWLTQSKL